MAYGALSGDLFQMASGRRAGMQNQASGIQLPRVQAPSLINDDDDDKEKDQTAAEGIRTAGPAGMIKPGSDEDGRNSNASPMAAGPAGYGLRHSIRQQPVCHMVRGQVCLQQQGGRDFPRYGCGLC